ncbi:hydroxyacylglutathione hydrolase [Cognatazoarcus halotolerans]|uniref:hydroxyacylglutathione hydrolase n=1 Tax=Cognatazoarcus halotolerans TaxID=2686016 RepID=UPI001359B72D|nr:hydroxyacylglutathione hydrolase [Cognatazoarcus halotolerans]MBX3680712.1 hydroxyacylglutathione hydrolase [Rhodocyclaceae bacterium]MCB1900211.1 hydroxyacylglutathione hydrolase [Rhodocyclaceae bacterium]MCP5309040.1 hydroxyacylglutathione hydrolase [Zoogloeaceae bacterium]
MQIIPLPAFSDNYIWLIREGRHAVVVDPGDAAPVLDYLERNRLELAAILVTHHHADHVGGLDTLVSGRELPVYGPRREAIPGVNFPLDDHDRISVPEIGLEFEIIDVPGHTRGHIAYYTRDHLFCGDTLFCAGCGRIFEGTPDQLNASLQRLAALPTETRVYCTHEYTLSNLRFAAAAEPDNPLRDAFLAECERLRADGKPTLPSTIGRELDINPFLRCDEPGVRNSAIKQAGRPLPEPAAVFAVLREWKNHF